VHVQQNLLPLNGPYEDTNVYDQSCRILKAYKIFGLVYFMVNFVEYICFFLGECNSDLISKFSGSPH
jgi:hypothetical protein